MAIHIYIIIILGLIVGAIFLLNLTVCGATCVYLTCAPTPKGKGYDVTWER